MQLSVHAAHKHLLLLFLKKLLLKTLELDD